VPNRVGEKKLVSSRGGGEEVPSKREGVQSQPDKGIIEKQLKCLSLIESVGKGPRLNTPPKDKGVISLVIGR